MSNGVLLEGRLTAGNVKITRLAYPPTLNHLIVESTTIATAKRSKLHLVGNDDLGREWWVDVSSDGVLTYYPMSGPLGLSADVQAADANDVDYNSLKDDVQPGQKDG